MSMFLTHKPPFMRLVFALLLGGVVSMRGGPFRAEGTVDFEYLAPGYTTNVSRPFVAFVNQEKWLIRTTITDPADFRAYFEWAFNGTNLFKYFDLKPDPKVPDLVTASVVIETSLSPGSDPHYTHILPVWFALASASYFATVTNQVITPFWSNSPKGLPNYAPTARSKFSQQQPAMLEKADLYETAGFAPGAYKGGFLRQGFETLTWTNVGGMSLPLECVLRDYSLKTGSKNGKMEFTGIGPDDVRIDGVWTVRISKYEVDVSLKRYEPGTGGKFMVEDRRFAQASPSVPVILYSSSGTNYPDTNSRTPARLYSARVAAAGLIAIDANANQDAKRGVFLALLILVSMIFAAALRHYRKTTNQEKNETN